MTRHTRKSQRPEQRNQARLLHVIRRSAKRKLTSRTCATRHKLLLAKDELPTDAVKKNIAPRQAARKLSATNPFYARLEDIESHMYEAGGFMGVGIAVLCALQAGVAKGSVSLYSTSYLSAKALWMLFYFLSQEMFVRSEIAGVLGVLRTFSFLGSLASVAQLLAAAATQ